MEPKEILEATRRLIQEHAGDDPDKWWYANRFVFVRLQLDERKTKSTIKKELLDSRATCPQCGKPFSSRSNVHLHRIDGDKAYSRGNCVLMHPECHRQCHAEDAVVERTSPRQPTVTKQSKRYDDRDFTYWWDISPVLAAGLADVEAVEFVKKDTGERAVVPTDTLMPFLTAERKTSRSDGNWGIKVLNDRPDELAFEPGAGNRDWKFLPVTWLEEAED